MALIPKNIAGMIPRLGTVDASDVDALNDASDYMVESSGQKELRMNRMVRQDKERAIVKCEREISSAKSMLEKTQDPALRKQLTKKIKKSEFDISEAKRFMVNP